MHFAIIKMAIGSWQNGCDHVGTSLSAITLFVLSSVGLVLGTTVKPILLLY